MAVASRASTDSQRLCAHSGREVRGFGFRACDIGPYRTRLTMPIGMSYISGIALGDAARKYGFARVLWLGTDASGTWARESVGTPRISACFDRLRNAFAWEEGGRAAYL